MIGRARMGIYLASDPSRVAGYERAAPMLGGVMQKYLWSLALTAALAGSAACANTARGVVEDTKENTSAVRGGLETVDVKSAIIADKTIDSGAIDVDTYQDKKVVVLRGSVPTEAQKQKAEQIARDNAKGYTVENRLVVAK
jgi:osmotically-inducible protein OsmY